MWKFKVDVVHEFGSSLRADVGRRFFTRLQRVLVSKAFGMTSIKTPVFYSINKTNSESLRSD